MARYDARGANAAAAGNAFRSMLGSNRSGHFCFEWFREQYLPRDGEMWENLDLPTIAPPVFGPRKTTGGSGIQA